MRNAHKPIMT